MSPDEYASLDATDLAALISVPESMETPHLCQEINVAGFLTVLEEASAAGYTQPLPACCNKAATTVKVQPESTMSSINNTGPLGTA